MADNELEKYKGKYQEILNKCKAINANPDGDGSKLIQEIDGVLDLIKEKITCMENDIKNKSNATTIAEIEKELFEIENSIQG